MHPALFLLSILLTSVAHESLDADYVIRGATLYDGSGRPSHRANLAVKGDRIVAVGNFETAGNPKIIDGTGLIVAPGFIDLHSHSDFPQNGFPTPATKLSDLRLAHPATRSNLNYLVQGVTTVVTGNCGAGPADVAAYFKTLEAGGVGSNVIHQVPHNAVRQKVMGNVNRLPTAMELNKMEEVVEQGMNDGAWGLSTGLIYNPGTYAKTEELIALAKVAARHGGFYASHIRGEGVEVLTSIEEALTVGREAKLPVHISHLKASGRKAWGKAGDVVALIQQARDKGQVVTADQYPYTASSTSLSATLVPPQFREGTHQEFLARLDDAEQGPRLKKAIEDLIKDHDDGSAVRIALYAKKPQWQGKNLLTIAKKEDKTVLDIVLEIERNGGAGVVILSMSEEDVRYIMKQPFVATASDGSAMVPGPSVPHPRSYGCFARKVGRFAIEEKLISLEQAIRSASGLPADILRLKDRGYLKPGYYADIVLFDPKTYRDRATFEKPHQYATGVRYLFVNGILALDNGKYITVLPGKVLRHPARGSEP